MDKYMSEEFRKEIMRPKYIEWLWAPVGHGKSIFEGKSDAECKRLLPDGWGCTRQINYNTSMRLPGIIHQATIQGTVSRDTESTTHRLKHKVLNKIKL